MNRKARSSATGRVIWRGI